MRKIFLSTLAMMLSVFGAYAQPVVYGNANESEVIEDVRFDANDNSIVHVGYIYANNNQAQSDCYIFKTDLLGNKIWERRFGYSFEDKFKRLDIGPDGNYYVVGWTESQLLGSILNTFKGLICKYSPTGTFIWSRQMVDAGNGGNVGPMLYGVHVRANNDVIVVGSTQPATTDEEGLIAAVEPIAGASIWQSQYNATFNNFYYDVTERNDTIFACGFANNVASSRGILTACNPVNGNHYASAVYNPPGTTYKGFTLSSIVFRHINVNNGNIILDGLTSDNVNSVNNTVIVTHQPLTATLISNPTNNFSNYSRVFTIQQGEYVIAQHPGATSFAPENVTSPAYNYLLSHINGTAVLQTATPNTTSLTPLLGQRVLWGLDINGANDLLSAGLIRNAAAQQIGQDDIYTHVNNLPFNLNRSCPDTTDTVSVTTTPLTKLPIQWGSKILWQHEPFAVPIQITTDTMWCKTDTCRGDDCNPVQPCDTCCPDTCYWTLVGNVINMPKNKLGTISYNDIRIITNNTQRALISKDGYTGISITAPATTLHVECAPPAFTNPPSGLKLDNVPDGAGHILVVDDNGWVYKTRGIVEKHSNDELKQEIEDLKQQVLDLKNMMNGTSGTSGGGTQEENSLKVSPNPNNGMFDATYKVAKPFKTAQIRITDNTGKLLLIKDINSRATFGTERINISKAVASQQITCTLICDGQIIAEQQVVMMGKQ